MCLGLSTSVFLKNKNRVSKKATNLTLINLLRNWMPGSQWFQRKWQNYYDSFNKELYMFNTNTQTYNVHKKWRHSRQRLRGRTRGTLFHKTPHRYSQQLPPNLFPTDVISSTTFHRIGIVFPTNALIPTPQHNNWGSYIQSLPLWERQIIQHNTIFDLHWLHAHIQHGQTFIQCSDGSANDTTGSFGSIISDGSSILATVQGHVAGLQPHSFLAEAYGVLAHLLLLLRQQQYYQRPSPSTLIIYCDNDGLLTRLKQHMTIPQPAPRHFLSSEIEIILRIQHTLQQLAANYTSCHVKGHQDDNTSFDKLPWPAQLKILCDTLTTESLSSAPTVPFVPINPLLPATLTIDHCTITRHIPAKLCHACDNVPIQSRLQHIYNTLLHHHH